MEPMAPTLLCMDPHIWNLNVIGLFRLHPKTLPIKKLLHYMYMVLINTLEYIYVLQEIVYTIQVRSDLDKVVESSFLLLTHFDTIAKQIVLSLRAERLHGLMDILNGEIFNRRIPVHDVMLKKTAVTARTVLRAFTGAALFTCLLWGLFPYFDHITGTSVIFSIWLPWIDDTNVSPVFEYVLVYSTLHKALLGFGNTTMDAFISTILATCKTQISILRYDLERLPETCAAIAKDNQENVKDVLNREFIKCMDHYSLVTNVTKELQDIFGGVILFQFAVSGWIICMTAYMITDMKPASVEFVSMMFYMSCILVELFLFCYYGNELTIESELISESVYTMYWLNTDVKFQKGLVMLMERTKRPIQLTAGVIIPLSLPTFLKVLKSSYSLYAVLRETK